METIHTRFDSYGALIAAAKLPGHPRNDKASLDKAEEFTGTKDYQEALDLAAVGWPEGLASMNRLKDQITPLTAPLTERLAARFAESGDEVDIGQFLTGDPEHMLEFSPQYVPSVGRVVRLVVNGAISSVISPTVITNRGVSVLAIADQIEQSGLRCEIVSAWIRSCPERPGRCQQVEIPIKRPDEPMELDRLAFVFAHPSYVRRICFRILEQSDPGVFGRTLAGAYGQPCDLENIPEGDIYFPCLLGSTYRGQFDTLERAAATINSTIAKYVEPQPA